jgi:hypothetical protein
MSVQRRKDAIAEYHRLKNERDTSEIPYVTFTINKSDWEQSLKNKIIEELGKHLDDSDAGLKPIFEKFMESKKASPILDKEIQIQEYYQKRDQDQKEIILELQL